jgi:hypothetical protein
MESLEFIQLISKIQWSDLSRTDSDKILSEDGFSLSFNTDLHTDKMFPSVQIIARLCYNGTLVINYGFTDDDSQRAFIKLWKTAKAGTYDLSDQRDKANKAAAKQILENLRNRA